MGDGNADTATAKSAAPTASGSAPSVELTVGGAALAVYVADYFIGTVASYQAANANDGGAGTRRVPPPVHSRSDQPRPVAS